MTGKIDALFEDLLGVLQAAEKRHKTVYEKASDNNDWETVDRALEIIPSITKWRRAIDSLRSEIMSSGYISDDDFVIESPEIEKQTRDILTDSINIFVEDTKTVDDDKIGRHIRNKLHELSSSGFLFTPEQISELCSVEWSKKTFEFSFMLPFAKLIDPNRDIREQTKGQKWRNRYWSDVFEFGQNKLLIISQWYAKDRASFDRWYESITSSPAEEIRTITFNPRQWDDGEIAARIDTQEDAAQIDVPEPEMPGVRLKPTKLILLGKEYVVTAWKEMFVKVCEIMLLRRPYIMAAMDKDTEFNTERRTHFSYIQSEIKFEHKRLSNGLWIETNENSGTIINICHKLLEKCGYSPDELQVETVEVR